MPYDLDEATGILARAHAALSPAAHNDRERAALDLQEAVKKAAVAAGYETQGTTIAQPKQGAVFTVVDGGFFIGVKDYPERGNTRTFSDLAIEYDPLTKMYIGTEYDDTIVPVPGEPRRRRSAVAVVAERIVALIKEQSEVRKRAR
jgi:hypothetical protein